jgi:multidrug efflux pump subunit AcrA (membrane-fusion protein)
MLRLSIAGLSIALVLAGSADAQKDDAVKPLVVAVPVIETQVRTGQRVVGTVRPTRTSTIGSAVDGRVLEYLVDRGEPVTAGQPLARLRTDTLEIELAAARAELQLYQHQLAELQNGSRPEEIAEARARMLGAKAAMVNAANQLERAESLSASRAASRMAVDDAQERAELTRYAYDAAQSMLKQVEEGPRIESVAQAASQVELQTQRVNLIEDRITKHTIIAPFDGFVAAEFTEIGAWVAQGDPIVEVIELNTIEVEAPAPAEYAIQIRKGDTIRVEFPELPDQLLTGIVQHVVPVADARARTFPVHIRITNEFPDGAPLLMVGMLARVELPAGSQQTLPLVPKDALVLKRQERSVFVVTPNGTKGEGKVRRVPVELGVALGGLIQVRGDIKAGDLVAILGNETLQDGQEVVISEIRSDEQVAQNDS